MTKRLLLSVFCAAPLCFALASPSHAASCGDGNINTSEQCDDGNKFDGDGCNRNCRIEEGFDCVGSHPSVCAPVACGNGLVQGDEECDDGDHAGGDGCNANCDIESGYDCVGDSPSVCDLVECGNGIVQSGEECDGGVCCSDSCTFSGPGTVCREQDGPCDVAERCTGMRSSCPADKHSTRMCRAAQGVCDAPEFCGPSSDFCPTDVKSTKICRAASAPCDAAERCDGESNSCPADDVASSGTICHASTGGCDPAEHCNGVATGCPADARSDSGTVCRPAVSPECDVAEVCTGNSAACPADVLVGCPDTDGIDCVHPACDVSGECTTTEDCVEICRQPPFWAGHSGTEKDRLNVTQTILDQVGPLDICGHLIDTTNLGELDSAVEALCVRPQGVEERTLFRALVTTALNCAISEGGTCDQIVSRFVDVTFSECNARCEGDAPSGSPTVDECIDQLFCFNRGGVSFGGQCALGTCAGDPSALCGDDFNACTDLDGDGDADRCEPFEGNCSDARLCTTGLDTEAQICVTHRPRPSSTKLCRLARRNDCTIDHCP